MSAVDRYPPIEPHAQGMLPVGQGNHIHWEVSGNPAGRPAVVLHGGPGSGCVPGMRRYFDPAAYRIVLFDQRGCGASTPSAADPATGLAANTTPHLLADLEALREHLGIDRWLLFGGSWGAVLGLAYAQRHPDRVSAIVLTGVATGRRTETDLLTRGLDAVFPEAWQRFRAGAPESHRDGDLAAGYAELLADPDPTVRERAARDWCDWESAIAPTVGGNPRFEDPVFRATFARIVTHYFRHGSWLDDQPVLANGSVLAGIPGALVQGVLDFNNLLGTPWLLARVWPEAELTMVEQAGHDTSSGIVSALVTATDRFAARP
jgi:proline iminopeptidase